jgi:hypothetical protein
MGLKIVGTCCNGGIFFLLTPHVDYCPQSTGSVVGRRQGISPCGFVVRCLGVDKELVPMVLYDGRKVNAEKLVPTVLYPENGNYWMTPDGDRKGKDQRYSLCMPQSNTIHYLLKREGTLPE